MHQRFWYKKLQLLGFPGGTVVMNLSVDSGDTGSIPDLGRSHMLQSTAHEPYLLSPCSRAREPQLLSPCATTIEAHIHGAQAPQ